MLWWRTVLFTIWVPGTELVLLPLVVVGLGLGPRLDFGAGRYLGFVPLSAGLAVIGRCFTPEVLAGCANRPIADLDEPLSELVYREHHFVVTRLHRSPPLSLPWFYAEQVRVGAGKRHRGGERTGCRHDGIRA